MAVQNVSSVKNEVAQIQTPKAEPKQKKETSIFDFRKDCAEIAANTYSLPVGATPLEDYKQLDQFRFKNEQTGFHAITLEKDDTIILAFAGTDMNDGIDKKDIVSNMQMFTNAKPAQYDDAMRAYLKVQQYAKANGKKVVITGHSLGGSLAQLVASTTKYNGQDIEPPRCVTFNAYGQKKYIDRPDTNRDVIVDLNNTINYVIIGDKVAGETEQDAINNQPGIIYSFPRSEAKFRDVTKMTTLVFGSNGANYHVMDQFCNDRTTEDFKNVKPLIGTPEWTYKDVLNNVPKFQHFIENVDVQKAIETGEKVCETGEKVCRTGVKVYNTAKEKYQDIKQDYEYVKIGTKLYMQDGKEVIVEKAGKVKQYCSEVGTGLKLYAQDAIKKVTPILSVIPHWSWW